MPNNKDPTTVSGTAVKGLSKGDFVEIIFDPNGTITYSYDEMPCTLKNCVYFPVTNSVIYEVESDISTVTDNISYVDGPGCNMD